MYVYISTNPFPGFYYTHSFTFTHTNVVQLLTSKLASLFNEKYLPTNYSPDFYHTLRCFSTPTHSLVHIYIYIHIYVYIYSKIKRYVYVCIYLY